MIQKMTFCEIQVALLLSTLLCLPSSLLAKERVVLSGIEESVNTEISLEVLKPAYATLGFEIDYVPLPGERAIKTSNQGKVDGEVFRIANVNRRYGNLIPIPTSINTLQAVVFSKQHKIDIKGWDSLKPYTIGIQVGIKFAERGTKGMRRVIVDTNEQLFKMLDAGRVDVIVIALTNGLQTLRALEMDNIRILHPPIQEYPLYHYVHKSNAALVPLLDEQFQQLKKSGHIREARDRRLTDLAQPKSFAQQ